MDVQQQAREQLVQLQETTPQQTLVLVEVGLGVLHPRLVFLMVETVLQPYSVYRASLGQ